MSKAPSVNPYKSAPLGSKAVGSVYGGAVDSAFSKISDEEVEELRRLLLAPEQYQLMQLHRRLDELEAPDSQLGAVAKYLPEAVAINARKGDKLAKALAQTFSRTLDVAVQQDTETLIDGISPLMVPALKRGIKESFRSTRNAVKWALQYGVSLNGIKWQYEAIRTKRSFSEVVLSHTLRYRVEQVFLIHRISGLPLQHVVADSVKAQDGSLVSSMLTAIQDFVQDSFGTRAEEGLATLQVGELTVWIEQGPKAILAAVVRGTPEPDLRRVLKDTARSIHLQFNAALTFFDGDITPFESTRPILEGELLSHYQIPQRPISPLFWVMLGGIVVWLSAMTFFFVRDNAYWKDYLALLKTEPGIFVIDAGRNDGKWFVTGLRDPLATPSDSLRVRTSLPAGQVTESWTPYMDMSSPILLRRAYQFLGPIPPEVTLQFENGVLTSSGQQVPKEWKESARDKAKYLIGIVSYNDDGAEVFDELLLRAQETALEQKVIYFQDKSAMPDSSRRDAMHEVFLAVRGVLQQAQIGHKNLVISVYGHATAGANEIKNIRISTERAEAVVSELIKRGLKQSEISVIQPDGLGSQSAPFYVDPRTGQVDSTLIQPFNAVTFDVVVEPRNWK
ncbi:MAG: OmpA family protein [Rhodothermales bacterium]|nr:OmpA family protein [Rhodothermales bacterium]